MPIAEILSQGDEVVTGQTVDTNASWLSDQLTGLGFTVVRHTAVGDRLADIEHSIHAAIDRADLVLSTGGLGPTDDDLTTTAVANVFGVDKAFDPVAMAHIEALYRRFGRPMPEVNRRQAWLPAGCVRLDNDWGTAPAFAMVDPRALTAFLPGVPREMKALFQARILPLIQDRFDLHPGQLITLRTTGIGESNLQERVGPFSESDVVLSYRTKLPENHIKLRFSPGTSPDRIQAVTRSIADRIGSPLFCIEGVDDIAGDLAHVVVGTLAVRNASVASAESCTGGRIASAITSVAGSSAVFNEAVVTYSNSAKVRHLGVQPASLDTHGAVSELVARQMADGVRQRSGSTFALAATGIAGPGGGTDAKPVGTVFVALATPEHTHVRHLKLAGGRDRIQTLATAAALDLLRRHLQGVLPAPDQTQN